jgi:hypothetical protein
MVRAVYERGAHGSNGPGTHGSAAVFLRLRLPAVQLAHFGRLLTGTEDRLPHHRIEWLRITDPAVVATSGIDSHPILRYSAAADDFVEGTVFELSDEELAAADLYEVGEYERVLLRLESGLHGWIYAGAP